MKSSQLSAILVIQSVECNCGIKSVDCKLFIYLLQMRNLLSFKTEEDELSHQCPCREDIREILWNFHHNLLKHCSMPTAIGEELEKPEEVEKEPEPQSVTDKLLQLVWKTKEEEIKEPEHVNQAKIGKCRKSCLPYGNLDQAGIDLGIVEMPDSVQNFEETCIFLQNPL